MKANEVTLSLEKYERALSLSKLLQESGKITQVVGQVMKGYLPGASVGSICRVYPGQDESFLSEVIGFTDRQVLMMPLGEMRGVGLGSKVILERSRAAIKVGPEILGRVVNSLGEPIDALGTLEASDEWPLYRAAANPLSRPPISEPLDVGIRAINGLLTVGRGQRVAILAGSGVGKSVLMGMMARSTTADVNVIALVGERGREVREFIEQILGEEGRKKSVVVVATSDQSPLLRMRAAFAATAIAESFCESGANVLLMMDSVTRFAMAQREIGLSAGEPPASKGYTPSVFAMLPKVLERSGTFEGKGSITGFYTVLVEGDDMDEPIADSVRSIVDGHIVLSRTLAQRGHFPAIDILQSTSRVMRQVVDPKHEFLARRIRETLSVYTEAQDLINIGAYKMGASPQIDQAVQLHDQVIQFLRQETNEATDIRQTNQLMRMIYGSN